MGVSGAGKSTIGRFLAEELEWSFYEGDDFHPPANIRKMTHGIALTDADRAAWLSALSQLICELDRDMQSAVVACSALKQAYREKLTGKITRVQFVYLKGSYDLILGRLQTRRGHYMKPDLLKSQFEILEEPGQALVIDAAQTPEMIVRQIRQALKLPLMEK